MDSSFVIKPRAPVHKSYAPRDPVPVRASIETELDTSRTVNATGSGDDKQSDQGRDDGQGRHDDPRSDHASYEVAVDPDNRDKLFRERDVRAADREHPDQALLRQRAYGHTQAGRLMPARGEILPAAESHADIEA